MSTDADRASRWRRHEGTITTAVLTLVFVGVVVWGVSAGWDLGSITVSVMGAVLNGALTTAGVRRSAKRRPS